ncbi:hypothetical protein [Candidatus Pantoea deserta]|uniref:hypothetical protein n=1 Tax=Candidatus Pantoea deserta TaxID=1869313 RepID=UPI00131A1D74|nr:hypothetical protein [Pantoea deserta]
MPQDVAVIGFAAARCSAITTVRALLARLSGKAVPEPLKDIGFDVIVRDSA